MKAVEETEMRSIVSHQTACNHGISLNLCRYSFI